MIGGHLGLPPVLGGVYGRGVRDSYLRILDSLDTDQLYVQEDLTKYFDGIRHEDLQVSLKKLGAPKALCSLVQGFHRNHVRVFTHHGQCRPGARYCAVSLKDAHFHRCWLAW